MLLFPMISTLRMPTFGVWVTCSAVFFSPGGGATSLHSDRFRPYLRLRLEFASLVDHRVVPRDSYSSGINVRWCLTVKYAFCSVIHTHFWMSALFAHVTRIEFLSSQIVLTGS